MDITSATATAAVAARTNPDSGAETPPPRPATNKPMGFLAYANGALKRHYPTAPALVVPKPESPVAAHAAAVSYKECMRNHAATIGGHALDGCCEFMPSPMFNPSDPTSLRCAACGCHRNFHRRDPDDPAPLQLQRQNKTPSIPFPLLPTAPPRADSPSSPPTPATFSAAPHMLLALRKSQSPAAANGGSKSSSAVAGKKRFRTKFSQEQKEKMYDFAEKLGWKMQKIDKGEVDEFCNEIGVGKEVLKIWMHNNKNTLGKRDKININGGDGTIAASENGDRGTHFERVHVASANGSSSSSG